MFDETKFFEGLNLLMNNKVETRLNLIDGMGKSRIVDRITQEI